MTTLGPTRGSIDIELPDQAGRLVLSWGAQTNTGMKRAENQDSFLAAPPVFAVADGMGGHAAGDEASAAVVERLAEQLAGPFIAVDAVIEALRRASADISDIGAHALALNAAGAHRPHTGAGAGTTATGIALTLQSGAPYWMVFNIGDSRVYSLSEGTLAQLTVDHSAVQVMVDSGRLTALEAETHPDRNMITRAVGFGNEPIPDLWFIPVREGSRLLVCSDGLTKEVDFALIGMLLREARDADDAAGLLLEAALASGGRDNITTLVVEVVRFADEPGRDETVPRGA